MASKYEITPLNSNKTILMIVKDIEKHLHDNPLYKVYFADASYSSGTLIYDVDDLSIPDGDELTTGDIVVFNNSYYAEIDAIGTETYTIKNVVLFKGDKGDTGATGETGATGNGIATIEKTSTSGLVDTYTITYTNGTTATFEVTNGANGQDGNGIVSIEKTGTSGNVDTYTITYTNGNTDTFTITNAPQTITASNIDSETATSGKVLTADGSGGASWEDAQGGSGGMELLWSGVSPNVNRSSLSKDITNYTALIIKTASVGSGFDSCDVIIPEENTHGCAHFSVSGTDKLGIFYDVSITSSVISITNGTRLNLTTASSTSGGASMFSIYGIK